LHQPRRVVHQAHGDVGKPSVTAEGHSHPPALGIDQVDNAATSVQAGRGWSGTARPPGGTPLKGDNAPPTPTPSLFSLSLSLSLSLSITVQRVPWRPRRVSGHVRSAPPHHAHPHMAARTGQAGLLRFHHRVRGSLSILCRVSPCMRPYAWLCACLTLRARPACDVQCVLCITILHFFCEDLSSFQTFSMGLRSGELGWLAEIGDTMPPPGSGTPRICTWGHCHVSGSSRADGGAWLAERQGQWRPSRIWPSWLR